MLIEQKEQIVEADAFRDAAGNKYLEVSLVNPRDINYRGRRRRRAYKDE